MSLREAKRFFQKYNNLTKICLQLQIIYVNIIFSVKKMRTTEAIFRPLAIGLDERFDVFPLFDSN